MTQRWPSHIIMVCILVCSAHAYAASPVPNDFAYGITIQTEGQASLWQIRLPDDVYRKVTRSDLGDIRVFDETNQIIPFTIRRPEAMTKGPPAPINLPIFPLYRSDEKDSVSHALRIITDNKGAIVDTISETIAAGKKDIISAYLLDASKTEHALDKLILEWESSKQTGFSVNVNVDKSEDLSSWHRVTDNAILADLKFGEHQLSHREIKLPVNTYKYLRITWPAELSEVQLEKVIAIFPTTEHPPQRHWIQITGVIDPGKANGYDFDTLGYWPVDQARIVFQLRNVVMDGELSSRPNRKSIWIRKFAGLFYHLTQNDGSILTSPPVTFATISDQYWRLEEVGSSNTLARHTPVLELGWIPHTLTFIAQGNPPYKIAYGSTSIGPLDHTMDRLLQKAMDSEQKQALIKTAKTSPSYTLGGVKQLEPPPEPLPWKVWLLWLVLIAGVVLLAWMVWRLSRQMGKTG